MSLYKEPKSPHLWSRHTVAGRKVKRSTGTADRELAAEFDRTLGERLYRQHRLGDTGAISLREAVKRWVIEQTAAGVKTAKQEKSTLTWFVKLPNMAETSLSAMNTPTIESLRQLLLRAGNSKSTVNRKMNVLRALLRRAHREWQLLAEAPVVPAYPATAHEPRWLTPPEFERLYSELPEHLKAPARFAVLTGLRKGSMLKLTWDRIDMESKRFWIPAAHMKAGKTLGLPLSQPAVELLKSVLLKNQQGPWVFQYEGKRLQDAHRGAFQKAVKRAGLSPLRWHDLRHTWASWAVQRGVALHYVKELGGWSSMSMVMVYAHLAPDHLAAAAEMAAGKKAETGSETGATVSSRKVVLSH